MSLENNEIPINYTKEAFLQPINLGALLAFTILGFAAGAIGLASNLILTLICAVELLYLGIVPKMPRFRKVIKIRKLSERNPELEEKDIFKRLGENGKRQYLVLRRLVKLVKKSFDTQPYSSQGLLDSIRKKIDKLLSDYLTLLDLHKRYNVYTKSNIEERLQKEVSKEKKLIDKLKSEKLRKTKRRRVNILKKRLKKFEVAKEKYLICETHLETIEDAIRYIYEQSITMSDPEEIGMQLDNVLTEMEETSAIISELDNAPFINQIDFAKEEKLDIELEQAKEKKRSQEKREKVKG